MIPSGNLNESLSLGKIFESGSTYSALSRPISTSPGILRSMGVGVLVLRLLQHLVQINFFHGVGEPRDVNAWSVVEIRRKTLSIQCGAHQNNF